MRSNVREGGFTDFKWTGIPVKYQLDKYSNVKRIKILPSFYSIINYRIFQYPYQHLFTKKEKLFQHSYLTNTFRSSLYRRTENSTKIHHCQHQIQLRKFLRQLTHSVPRLSNIIDHFQFIVNRSCNLIEPNYIIHSIHTYIYLESLALDTSPSYTWNVLSQQFRTSLSMHRPHNKSIITVMVAIRVGGRDPKRP